MHYEGSRRRQILGKCAYIYIYLAVHDPRQIRKSETNFQLGLKFKLYYLIECGKLIGVCSKLHKVELQRFCFYTLPSNGLECVAKVP